MDERWQRLEEQREFPQRKRGPIPKQGATQQPLTPDERQAREPGYAFFGLIPGEPVAAVCSVLYLAFFAFMPWYSRMDATKPEPERVTWK